jgi:hypothetical protein
VAEGDGRGRQLTLKRAAILEDRRRYGLSGHVDELEAHEPEIEQLSPPLVI